MFGAKLSWCQIVRCQIVLVPNCPGGKLSTFIILVPNCLFLLSWCQIVCFYYLGAKLSVFLILVPSCPLYYLGAKLSSAKLSGAKLSALLSWCQIVQCQIVRCQIVLQSKSGTIFFISNIYIPKMKNKKNDLSF